MLPTAGVVREVARLFQEFQLPSPVIDPVMESTSGAKLMEKRAGRATSSGRIAVYAAPNGAVGAMVDLRCESAPVAANQEFVQLASDLAQQLATGPGAATPEAAVNNALQAFGNIGNEADLRPIR